MYPALQFALYAAFMIALACTVYFSFAYRRQRDATRRGLYQSRLNISMGAAMILLSLYPLLLIPGSNTGMIVGIIFLLIGCFNLYSGIRNHGVYRSRG